MAGGHRTSGLDLLRFGYGVMQDRKAEDEKKSIQKAYGWAAGFDPSQYLADPQTGVKEIVSNLPGDVAYTEVERFNNYVKEQHENLRAEREQRRVQGITQTPQFGPLKGQYFNQQNPNPAASPEAIQERLFRTGNPQALEYATKGADLMGKIKTNTTPEDPMKTLEAGYRTFLTATGMDNGLPAYRAYQQSMIEQRKAGATNVNTSVNTSDAGARIGTIPPGFEAFQTDSGAWSMREVPGGPAEITRLEEERKRKAGMDVVGKAAQTVFEDGKRSLDIINEFGHMATGPGAMVSDWLPTTPAGRLNAHIDSIKGNIGIDQLLKIKESGSGLGQVPQAQLEMLAGLLGKLSPRMNRDDLVYNVERIVEIYEDIARKTGGDPHQVYADRVDSFGAGGSPSGTGSEPKSDPLGLFK